MDEYFSDMARNKLQTELLYAVKGLKGQVVNQKSLSVGMEWKKAPQAIKKVKTDYGNKRRTISKSISGDGELPALPTGKNKKKSCFWRTAIPKRA